MAGRRGPRTSTRRGGGGNFSEDVREDGVLGPAELQAPTVANIPDFEIGNDVGVHTAHLGANTAVQRHVAFRRGLRRSVEYVEVELESVESHMPSALHEYQDSGDEEEVQNFEIGQDGDVDDPSNIKHIFRGETWSHCDFKYSQSPRDFVGSASTNTEFRCMLSFIQLFSLFWPYILLQKIVIETNWYATTPDENGKCPGGATWIRFTVAELKAFLAVFMLMGLKWQPNLKTYWSRKGSFFTAQEYLKYSAMPVSRV